MSKKIPKGALLSLVMAALCLVAGSAAAADAKDLVLKGDAKCTACHDEADAPELLGIGRRTLIDKLELYNLPRPRKGREPEG